MMRGIVCRLLRKTGWREQKGMTDYEQDYEQEI